MRDKEVVDLAKQIIELDILRDQIWEDFAEAAGERAGELLRKVQNSQKVG